MRHVAEKKVQRLRTQQLTQFPYPLAALPTGPFRIWPLFGIDCLCYEVTRSLQTILGGPANRLTVLAMTIRK
eukprot:s459_g20.t1